MFPQLEPFTVELINGPADGRVVTVTIPLPQVWLFPLLLDNYASDVNNLSGPRAFKFAEYRLHSTPLAYRFSRYG